MVSSKLWLRSWAIVVLLVGGWSAGAAADTKTWTGAIDALWSTTGNWAGGTPSAGDRVVFPVSASNRTNTNDLSAGTVFFDITFLGSSYVINGNTIGLSAGIPASNGSNNRINADLQLTAPQTLRGAFCCAGLTLAGNIDIGANATTIAGATVSGVISGTGAVSVGDVTNFTGNNIYSGPTTVSGRGQIDGNQPGSAVLVNGGSIGRLSGNGTVGSVTTAGVSTQLTPGANLGGSPGKLTTGGLSFGNNTSYVVQLNGSLPGVTYDQVVANGSVTIGSSVNLDMTLNYSPSNGQVLMLLDNDGIDAVIGAFSGLPEGTTVTMNASDFQISYVGGSGNDVVLTVTAAAKTWTGAVNNLWSVAGNWIGGVPGAGDPLVFPNGAANLLNNNDLPSGTVYKQLLFTGSSYIISGNTIGLSAGIPASNGSNNRINADLQLTAPQTLRGAFCCAGLTLAGNIDIGANATTIAGATVSGVISGTGAVSVGDVTNFTGNNIYSGPTTVSGRGQIDGNQPGSAVLVNGGSIGRLSGNGTVGSVTTAGVSTQLTPGANLGGSPGKLTTGGLSFGNNTSYVVQLNGSLPGVTYDQVVANGSVTIGSSVNLSVSLGFTPARGQIFVIGLNDGNDAVSGTFNGFPQGFNFNLGPYPFEISYIGKTGNEIILTSLTGDSLNYAPVAVPDTFVTAQNTPLSVSAPGVLANDSDADLDAITVVLAPDTTAQGGTLTVNADGSFLYVPPAGYVGLDYFTYIISDGNDATDLATVTINVQDLQPPIVTVIDPNGGEIIVVGNTTKLSWSATDNSGTVTGVDLYISRDNGSTYQPIASNIANSGSYSWLVTPPGTNVDATPVYSALFKVEARDGSNNVGSDVSDSAFALHDLTTATMLSLFQASSGGDGIELRWQLGDPALFTNLTIERSESRMGPWVEVLLLERSEEGGVTVAFDRTAEPELTYFYRLIGTTHESNRVVLGQLSGSARMEIKEFAISRMVPNPSRGPLRIEYALPRGSRVHLSVLDIQGREVAVLADGVFKAGRYQATWTGQTDRGAAPAGVYFVRCQALGRNLTERLVRLQ